MRPKEILIDPDNVDADGIAEAQSVTGAVALTLDGALISDSSFTADIARRIGVLSAGNDAGITFTVVGTDPDGKAQTEAITGDASAPGTAESTGYYKTIASITSSGSAAGNVSVGTVDEFSTNTIPLNTGNSEAATVSIEDITGTFDVSVEQTFSRIQYSDIIFHACSATLTNATTKVNDDIDNHASGIRLIASSYTSGADLKLIINQNR